MAVIDKIHNTNDNIIELKEEVTKIRMRKKTLGFAKSFISTASLFLFLAVF